MGEHVTDDATKGGEGGADRRACAHGQVTSRRTWRATRPCRSRPARPRWRARSVRAASTHGRDIRCRGGWQSRRRRFCRKGVGGGAYFGQIATDHGILQRQHGAVVRLHQVGSHLNRTGQGRFLRGVNASETPAARQTPQTRSVRRTARERRQRNATCRPPCDRGRRRRRRSQQMHVSVPRAPRRDASANAEPPAKRGLFPVCGLFPQSGVSARKSLRAAWTILRRRGERARGRFRARHRADIRWHHGCWDGNQRGGIWRPPARKSVRRWMPALCWSIGGGEGCGLSCLHRGTEEGAALLIIRCDVAGNAWVIDRTDHLAPALLGPSCVIPVAFA